MKLTKYVVDVEQLVTSACISVKLGVTDGVLVTLGVGDIEIDGVGVGEGHVFTAVHSVQILPG